MIWTREENTCFYGGVINGKKLLTLMTTAFIGVRITWSTRRNEPNDVLIFGENEPVISYKHLDGGDFKISICY